MQIHHVQILNWEPPGAEWWNSVEAKPSEPLIKATINLTLSFEEYQKLLAVDGLPEKE